MLHYPAIPYPILHYLACPAPPWTALHITVRLSNHVLGYVLWLFIKDLVKKRLHIQPFILYYTFKESKKSSSYYLSCYSESFRNAVEPL